MNKPVQNLISNVRKGKIDQSRALEILVDGGAEEKAELALFIGTYRIGELLDPLRDAFEMELDPEIRGLYYWAISLIAPEQMTNTLVEWILDEENEDVKRSMVESFLTFAERHDIPLETIKIQKEKVMEPFMSVKVSSPVQMPKSTTHEQLYDNVLHILNKFRPKIPVSLQRISSLAGISINELTQILDDLDGRGMLPGEYLRLEQVFIKDTKTAQLVKCTSCGSMVTAYPCPECGGGKVCATCRLAIDMEDSILTCPHCDAPSHSRHLLEWVKIKGVCPSCRNSISLRDLEDS